MIHVVMRIRPSTRLILGVFLFFDRNLKLNNVTKPTRNKILPIPPIIKRRPCSHTGAFDEYSIVFKKIGETFEKSKAIYLCILSLYGI
jgi:hypothetical protein